MTETERYTSLLAHGRRWAAHAFEVPESDVEIGFDSNGVLYIYLVKMCQGYVRQVSVDATWGAR